MLLTNNSRGYIMLVLMAIERLGSVTTKGGQVQLKLVLDQRTCQLLLSGDSRAGNRGVLTERFHEAINNLSDNQIRAINIVQSNKSVETTVLVSRATRRRLKQLAASLDVPLKDLICSVVKHYYS